MQVACGKAAWVCTEASVTRAGAQVHKFSHVHNTADHPLLSACHNSLFSQCMGILLDTMCIPRSHDYVMGNRLGKTAELLCIAYVAARSGPIQKAPGLNTSTWQNCPFCQMIWSDLEGRRRRKQRHPGGVGLRRNGGRTCSNACLTFRLRFGVITLRDSQMRHAAITLGPLPPAL